MPFELPGAEGFFKFLEERFSELSVMAPQTIHAEDVLSKLNNTKEKVEAYEILSKGEQIGFYLTIGRLEDESENFGCVYYGRLGEINPKKRIDDHTLIYWNQNPLLNPPERDIKLINFQRSDEYTEIPFPNLKTQIT